MFLWLKKMMGGKEARQEVRREPFIAPYPAPPNLALKGLDQLGDMKLSEALPSPDPPPVIRAAWLANLPGNVLFLDVETTGLHSDDRIVSIGLLLLRKNESAGSQIVFSSLHIILDPGKKSHPRAEEVHGYDEWTLRHQPLFSENANEIFSLIEQSSLLVGHNIAFDLPFIERELEAAGLTMPKRPSACTMQAWRARIGGRASLSAITAQLGLSRAGSIHCALEDAWFSFAVWGHLNFGLRPEPFFNPELLRPTNFVVPPPRPDGPLPRRRRRKVLPHNPEAAAPLS
jgi:DNA polymerase-3 subunit epsilon